MTYLKRSTLNFFYFCKFVELFFLTSLTVYIFMTGITVINFSPFGFGTEFHILSTIMVPILILVAMNLFYQNLLLNLRFNINLKSRTAGLICYDYVNYVFCHCWLESPCNDKCGTNRMLRKWLFKLVAFGGTIWLVTDCIRLCKNGYEPYEISKDDAIETLHGL